MLTAYNFILLIIIIISFIGTIGEKNKSLQEKMLMMFVCSLIAFTIGVMYP